MRRAAVLDERTRLGTLFIAPAGDADLTVGEFVDVTIEGSASEAALRIPQAALTSGRQLWVVDGGQLAERQVDVLGFDGDTAIVDAFDSADGVVAVPPSNVRAGLLVETRNARRVAGAASTTRASK